MSELDTEIPIVEPPSGDPPIYRVTMPDGPTLEVLDDLFTRLQGVAEAQQGALVFLIDARNIEPRRLTAMHRKRAGEYFKALTDALGDRFGGQVIVFNSPLQRGILTAVTWLFSPPWPLKLVGDLRSAEACAKDLIRGRLGQHAA